MSSISCGNELPIRSTHRLKHGEGADPTIMLPARRLIGDAAPVCEPTLNA
ncbi:hypothetical protein [Massilia pseudoviolaceinigra]|nr:hypothetical protein [Massilia sp. CCM 9206]MDQ1923678.1 hypothetical protein [Massilia sp. CCM 9206]